MRQMVFTVFLKVYIRIYNLLKSAMFSMKIITSVGMVVVSNKNKEAEFEFSIKVSDIKLFLIFQLIWNLAYFLRILFFEASIST